MPRAGTGGRPGTGRRAWDRAEGLGPGGGPGTGRRGGSGQPDRASRNCPAIADAESWADWLDSMTAKATSPR